MITTAVGRICRTHPTITGVLTGAYHRIRAAVPWRRTRVVAIGCPTCRRWVKPRHYIDAANRCRHCPSLTPPPGRKGHR